LPGTTPAWAPDQLGAGLAIQLLFARLRLLAISVHQLLVWEGFEIGEVCLLDALRSQAAAGRSASSNLPGDSARGR